MFVVYFNIKGIAHWEFVCTGVTVNLTYIVIFWGTWEKMCSKKDQNCTKNKTGWCIIAMCLHTPPSKRHNFWWRTRGSHLTLFVLSGPSPLWLYFVRDFANAFEGWRWWNQWTCSQGNYFEESLVPLSPCTLACTSLNCLYWSLTAHLSLPPQTSHNWWWVLTALWHSACRKQQCTSSQLVGEVITGFMGLVCRKLNSCWWWLCMHNVPMTTS